jgi:TniQ
MAGQAGLLELSAGSALRLDGTEWTVTAIEAQHGRVLLKAGGDEQWRSIRWLVHHPGCQAVPDGAAEPARPAGQPPSIEDLTGYQREVVRLRVAHLLETETGFRGGDPLHPGPGLAPHGRSGARLPVTLLADIPEPASRTFAFMTRLDAGEVARLGMSAWQERYPPLIVGPENAASGRFRLNGQLILAPVTRYCPDCLAGDGSAVQQSFGGPWLKAWHLPVVFACPAHQRLLEHLCRECGQPVRGRRPGAQLLLLPASRVAGLHPAQCRTELAPSRGRHTLPDCCRARLDQPGGRRTAGPELIAVQDKVLELLHPGGSALALSAGQSASPPRYFADL